MKVFAIGDLHLAGSQYKPMSIFGHHWENHQNKIEYNWLKEVTKEDIVAIPGDISWAMTLEEVENDLIWIDSLPGTKVLIRGNHDYWWKKIKYLNSLFDKMVFLQNNSFVNDRVVFTGSRGWLCPGSQYFKTEDSKIYERELLRLELSLQSFKRNKGQALIALIHYPPFNEKGDRSGFTDLFEKYNVDKVLYGHLHDDKSFNNTIKGEWRGVDYQLVSADYLNFNPMLVEIL